MFVAIRVWRNGLLVGPVQLSLVIYRKDTKSALGGAGVSCEFGWRIWPTHFSIIAQRRDSYLCASPNRLGLPAERLPNRPPIG